MSDLRAAHRFTSPSLAFHEQWDARNTLELTLATFPHRIAAKVTTKTTIQKQADDSALEFMKAIILNQRYDAGSKCYL